MAKEAEVQPHQHFKAGTQVEVSTEEDGFRGSWYAATVITPPPFSTARNRNVSAVGGSNKVTVEYRDLMEDEGSKKRLRETLDVVQIRPVPPRGDKEAFKLNDSVDAHYNDGWWEGVIVNVLEGRRFEVYFRPTKEQIEFAEDQLRIHREWVYGDWIPPVLKDHNDEASATCAYDNPSRAKRNKQSESSPALGKPSTTTMLDETPSKASSMLGKSSKVTVAHEKTPTASTSLDKPSIATMAYAKPSKIVSTNERRGVNENFTEGSVVEVKSDEDGFQGAWFSATVIKVLSTDKFLIEYNYLKTEDDKEFCREEVDILHIRPAPPDIVKVDSYSIYEEVDALYNDGWWVGVISKVYAGSGYLVFFRGTNEELKFDHSDLRVHQEWIDGKWIVSFQAMKQ